MGSTGKKKNNSMGVSVKQMTVFSHSLLSGTPDFSHLLPSLAGHKKQTNKTGSGRELHTTRRHHVSS